MQSLKLDTSASNYSIIQYPKKGYLDNLLAFNSNTLFNYIDKGNWVLENQNPLVNFLKKFSLSITQPDEYLYNEIEYKSNHQASSSQFTSIYNKGNSYQKVVFPEPTHQTLFVVPFGKPQFPLRYYQTTPLKNLNALTTIYTTDTRIRYSTNRMTENISSDSSSTALSIIQIDPFALCFGYIRYCRERIEKERFIGLTPNSYIAGLPLANFYMRHNQLVFNNQLFGKITVDTPKWTATDIRNELKQYLDFQNEVLGNIVFKSFHHYVQQLSQGIMIGGQLPQSIFPYAGNSRSYIQLSWVYSFGSMGWAIQYLQRLKQQNREDSAFCAYLQPFLKNGLTLFLNQIPNKIWKDQFTALFTTLKMLAG